MNKLTIEHVHKDFFRLCVGGIALVLARIGSTGILDQQKGCRSFSLHCDYRHATTRRVIIDYLGKEKNTQINSLYSTVEPGYKSTPLNSDYLKYWE